MRSYLETLARFDTPTICNVIELFGCRPRNQGYLHHSIHAIYPELPPVVGYAVTATFRSAQPPPPDERPVGLPEQVESFESVRTPRIMVIQDLDDPPEGAVYGEVMASAYKGFGCVGLVTNGFARDILQVRKLRFPCFATGISVSHAYTRIPSVGHPVTVGGVTIAPGDLLHADANGVTTIPLELAEQIAAACEEFVAAENVAISAARAGAVSPRIYRRAFEEFLRRRDRLAARISGKSSGDAGV